MQQHGFCYRNCYSHSVITSTAPNSRCGPGSVTLGATASNGVISWYRVATGGTLRGTGNSYTTIALSTTTTYYVEANQSGCITPTRTTMLATINTPVINPASLPSGNLGVPYNQSSTVSILTLTGLVVYRNPTSRTGGITYYRYDQRNTNPGRCLCLYHHGCTIGLFRFTGLYRKHKYYYAYDCMERHKLEHRSSYLKHQCDH